MQSVLSCAIFFIAACAVSMPAIGQNSSKKSTKKPVASAPQGEMYASREEAMRFADDVAERRNLDREWVRQAIGQARFVPTVQRLMRPMQPSSTGVVWKNWRVYRSRFIDAVRIQAGVKFWRENAAALEKAEAEFGVPAEIIVGIIGVETIYGRDMGTFRVMDALATLAFDFPKTEKRDRTPFFRDELEQFLSLKNRTGIDPMEMRGSYAGAMGLGQFMPSSWVKYAIDFDGDGKIDLFNSRADAIGSVANYFKSFGWKTGLPTHFPVSFDTAKLDMDALMGPDILPTFSVESFQAKGAMLTGAALNHPGPLALIELQNGDPALSPNNAPQYVAGTENFYVITRYNWSSYYAMSVIELGDLVKAAVK
ncbi:MAG: lytic murein transglycosylase B [Burkholderiales bacterium]|nr:MAG: lytic murein transglycosylase B [Burkholderiales bacterium]